MTDHPLEPALSTTLSKAAYFPFTAAATAAARAAVRTRTVDRDTDDAARAASALRARQTGEVTMPVALSFLAFW